MGSTADKVKGAANEAAGKVKQGVGHATNNKDLEAEGHKDEAVSKLKQAGEKVKDAFKA